MKLGAWVAGTALGLCLSAAGAASATTIDFSTYAFGTQVTTVGVATFSLSGGPGSGTPVTGSFGTYGLGNSSTGEYPTTEDLDVSFSAPVSNVSFTFDNFGDNSDFGAPSIVTAYNAADAVVGTLDVSSGAFSSSYALGSIGGADITELQFDNGSGGNYSWEFGVGELTFSAVPEPATWAMMLFGIGAIGAGMRMSRRQQIGAVAAV